MTVSTFDPVADWWSQVWWRMGPSGEAPALSPAVLLAVVGAGLLAVAVPPVWRALRVVVTLVHELGHALVGVAVGRRFTGFVLRGDMSGHAVTSGPPRGAGRVLTTWAGYPAPAVVGAALAWLGAAGWAAPAIAATLAVLLFALVRARSALTLVVTLLAIAAAGALWWWRVDAVQAPVLIGAGCVLVIGAWRHLGAVWAGGGPTSDPGVLARLTRVPAFVWNVTFALVCAAASAAVVSVVWPLVRG